MRLLISGATGALGQALLRQLTHDPAVTRIVAFSRSESRQADVAAMLPEHDGLRWIIGDVRDVERLEDAMHGCEAVIHTAALKKLDAMAYNPSELRRTNIEGSANVIRAAVRAGVDRVLMVSSDKAAGAVNAYGVSKAAMEQEAVAANSHALPRGTRIGCVRYGNVLWSTGSVLCLWQAAVQKGRPLKITSPKMTRFLLTLPHAALFCLTALRYLKGGEIFVPDLPAASIGDLADAFAPGHAQEIVGVRPGGEKPQQILLTPEEATRTVRVDPNTWAINPGIHYWRVDAPWTGIPWPIDREYASDQVRRLTVAEIRELIHGR